ncbi:MAG: DUF29 domain-containing protein [Pseudanabaenaceae cyanobacterium SKYGB_i_bin29]|nr:DUF29 domain-containing protein [Pseudanabaenaceae cyanobacterium SKYG29]MDW8420948.1 DUF29 domain-containing protein [Pseudanabaenaceae cyanobacterium SKYGB_i_bin29]
MRESLYNRDVVLWVEDTVAKLQSRDFGNLDLEKLITELEDWGSSQRNGARGLLRRLLEHSLKSCYVPLPGYYLGWQREIRNFRKDLQDLLADSPSLKHFLQEILRQTYTRARATVREDYSQINFPDVNPTF